MFTNHFQTLSQLEEEKKKKKLSEIHDGCSARYLVSNLSLLQTTSPSSTHHTSSLEVWYSPLLCGIQKVSTQ